MKFVIAILTVVAVLAPMSGATRAFLVTHDTAGVLFFDDLNEPIGTRPIAEVGTWGGGVTEMIAGGVIGGPAGAANGNTYLERWRGPDPSRSGASSIVDMEAVFTQPVSTGQLHIEFMYWNTDDWQSVGITDDNIGNGVPPEDGAAYIYSNFTQGSSAQWWDNRRSGAPPGGTPPGGSTGAALNLGQWNKMEIDIDLDNDLTEVKVNGISGGTYNGSDSVISRVNWRAESNNLGHFIDATRTELSPGMSFVVPSGRRQLFLDDRGIAEIQNLNRVMHQPEKIGPVITSSDPLKTVQTRTAPDWDPHEQVYKTWTIRNDPVLHQSTDGIAWVTGPDPNMRTDLVVYDASDLDPNRRFKAVLPNVGVAVSPDGINWSTVPGVAGVPSGDEYNLSFDEQNHQYILTVKRGGPYGRSVALATSHDFENWTDHGLIFHADAEDQVRGEANIAARLADPTLQQPEFNIPSTYNVDVYNMGIFRYEDHYIGLPSMFHQTGNVPPDWPRFDELNLSPDILNLVRTIGDWTGFHQVQLMSSRDLINWERLGDRQPFIDASTIDSGNHDLQTIIGPSYPVVHDDELWFYYTGIKHYAIVKSGIDPAYDDYEPNSGAVMLAVLRRDGFMSLDAGDQPGSVLTEPFVLSDEALFLNVDATSGWLEVEVLDEDDQVVAISEQLSGDIPFGQVVWDEGEIVDLLDDVIRLRFTLQNSSFYSYGVGARLTPSPSNFTWLVDAVGDWSIAEHWNPNSGPPGAGDEVVIDNSNAQVTVSDIREVEMLTVSAGDLIVQSGGTLTGTIVLDGGSLRGTGILGDVTNSGGVFAPGNVAAESALHVPEPTAALLLSLAGLFVIPRFRHDFQN